MIRNNVNNILKKKGTNNEKKTISSHWSDNRDTFIIVLAFYSRRY